MRARFQKLESKFDPRLIWLDLTSHQVVLALHKRGSVVKINTVLTSYQAVALLHKTFWTDQTRISGELILILPQRWLILGYSYSSRWYFPLKFKVILYWIVVNEVSILCIYVIKLEQRKSPLAWGTIVTVTVTVNLSNHRLIKQCRLPTHFIWSGSIEPRSDSATRQRVILGS